MADLTITGNIVNVGETQTFGTFTKRELWLSLPHDKYPQVITIEWHNDRGDLVAGLNEGEEVRVHFDLRGREHKGRVYNSLVGWKVERLSAPLPAEPDAEPSTKEPELLEDMPF